MKSERRQKNNKSFLLSPIQIPYFDDPCEICESPICGEGSSGKVVYKSYLSDVHDLPKSCDCDECLDFIMKQPYDPGLFPCFICDDIFEKTGMFKYHLKNDHGCIDKCGICFECIDCLLNGRWNLVKRGLSFDENIHLVRNHND